MIVVEPLAQDEQPVSQDEQLLCTEQLLQDARRGHLQLQRRQPTLLAINIATAARISSFFMIEISARWDTG